MENIYKKLYTLELWEELLISEWMWYTRVPWWWVMICDDGTCFIPYSNEFRWLKLPVCKNN